MPETQICGRSRAAGKFWGVVLAGGRGVRLKPFVKAAFGLETPKQFVPIMGRRSMFQHTVDRAALFMPDHRILAVTDVLDAETAYCQLGERPLGGVLSSLSIRRRRRGSCCR